MKLFYKHPPRLSGGISFLLLLWSILLPAGPAAAQAWQSATKFGEWTTPYLNNYLVMKGGVTTDAARNVYYAGAFSGTITLGTRTLTSAGANDAYVAKFNSSGTCLWAVRVGGSGEETMVKPVVDAGGNVYVGGSFTSPFVLVGATRLDSLGSGPFQSNNHYVAKLNSSGVWQWAVRAGGTVNALARDGSGNVYATGNFSNSSGTFGAITLTPNAGDELYVAKINASGVWQWAVNAPNTASSGWLSSNYTTGHALGVDANGNVYVSGGFAGYRVTFGTTTLTKSRGPESDEMDMFVAKLNASGAWQWANRVGNSRYTRTRSLMVDGSGNAYVTGYFSCTNVDFGSIHVLNANPDAAEFTGDVFVAKLDANGIWQWVSTAGGLNGEEGADLTLDASGNIYVVGALASTTAAFGATVIGNHDYGGRNPNGSIGAAVYDAFVAKLNAAGAWQWAIGAGGTGSSDVGQSLALDGTSGGIYVTGAFTTSATFGPTTLTHTPASPTSVGLFRARLLNQPAALTLAPSSGPTGTPVVLTGTGLTGATAVTFNGVAATSFTVNSNTQITATVPAAATTGPISVTTAGGTTLVSPGTFVVVPTLTSFTPTTVPGGATVTITGSGLTGAVQVWFGDAPATAFTVVSSTTITATAPASCGGTISVVTPGGTATSAAPFVGPPLPSSFSPTAGPVGTSVVIAGCNFTSTTTVRFNGVPAAITYNSPTQLTAVVPAGAITGMLTVTNATGTSNGSTFTVKVPPANDLCTAPNLPVLTCGVPVTGTTTDATNTGDPTSFCGTSPGTLGGVFYRFTGIGGTVTVSTCGAATDFDTRLFVYTGTCGALNCVGGNDDLSCSGQSRVSAVTFNSTLGTPYYIFVTGTYTGNFVLTVTAPTAPGITAISPTTALVGGNVTITGARLTGATAVRINGTPVTGYTVTSSTQITATVPPGATTGKVSVTTPSGTATSGSTLTVGPTITSLLPGQGAPGSVVVVVGTNFTGTTTVKINGVSATTTYHSPTQLSAVVPATATTGPVTATNTAGTATSPTNFTVGTGTPPTISSFSPTTNVAAGSAITITGTNFTGANVVRFNNQNATSFTVLSATQVRATIPAGTTSGRVFVGTPAGVAQSTAVLNVTQAPTPTTFTPAAGAAGSIVVLTGTNFTGVSSVKLAGVSAAFTVNSATQITATVPVGAYSGPLSVTTIAGTTTTAGNYTVRAGGTVPTITSLSPGSGARGSTFILNTNISGLSGSAIRIGNVTATFTVIAPTQYRVTVPATAVTGRVYVTSYYGMAQSPTDFTVILPPTITSFTPTTGTNTTLVTVNGTNFTGTTSVLLNNQLLPTFTVVSAAKLTFTPPAGSSSGLIQVVNPAGTATSSTAFTYTGPRPAALLGTETGQASAEAAAWTVFPNPAHGSVLISAPLGTRLTLLDGLGRVVRHVGATAETETRLDLTGLPPGLYVVRSGATTRRLVVE